MRDVVGYYESRLPGNPAAMLQDAGDPRRAEYLARFADREGRQYLSRYLEKYIRLDSREAMQLFRRTNALSERRLAWVFRTVRPEAPVDEFVAFLREDTAPEPRLERRYVETDPTGWSWQDLGYLAGANPLELWLLRYMNEHPDAAWTDIVREGADVRQEVYAWLMKPGRKQGQDQRIRTLLEEDAFNAMYLDWKAVGYPFDRLVPSLATSIGSSADRPVALAELVGIILRDGMRYPTVRVEELQFAESTPFETIFRRDAPTPERVLSTEVARAARDMLVDVVEQGTAQRAKGAFRDEHGNSLVMGGKTGTGDNRVRHFAPGGALSNERALNRTATFVFFVGDRYFGVITAFVDGESAAAYGFTSSLPVQVLKNLGPMLSEALSDSLFEASAPINALP
jgi:hypothetical protein